MQHPTWNTQRTLPMYEANGVEWRQLPQVCTATKLKPYLAFLGPSAKKVEFGTTEFGTIIGYLGHPRRRRFTAIHGQEPTLYFLLLLRVNLNKTTSDSYGTQNWNLKTYIRNLKTVDSRRQQTDEFASYTTSNQNGPQSEGVTVATVQRYRTLEKAVVNSIYKQNSSCRLEQTELKLQT